MRFRFILDWFWTWNLAEYFYEIVSMKLFNMDCVSLVQFILRVFPLW